MKEFYTYGSEAYAPLPIKEPSHLPDDPKKAEPLPEENKSVSLTTVIGAVGILVLFVGLLMSMVSLFEARSQQAELQRRIQQLKTQQERLITRYESEIDMDAVAKRAEEMGMHIPWADQIQYIDSASHTAETIEDAMVEEFGTMTRDMETYFPVS